jgi:hypothetical protein
MDGQGHDAEARSSLQALHCFVGWGEERTPTSARSGEKRRGSYLTPTDVQASHIIKNESFKR